jgi:hypothetical protein
LPALVPIGRKPARPCGPCRPLTSSRPYPLAARLRAAPWPVERQVPAAAPSVGALRGRAPELPEQELWYMKSEVISSLYFYSLLILILTSWFTISILSFQCRVLNFWFQLKYNFIDFLIDL